MKLPHLIYLFVVFVACRNEQSHQHFKTNSLGVKETSFGVKIKFSNNAKLSFVLDADKMQRREKQGSLDSMRIFFDKGLNLQMFDSLGEKTSNLSSLYGELFSEDQYAFLRGNVLFVNQNNQKMTTKTLHVYFDKDSLYTKDTVQIIGKKGRLKGVGFSADMQFKHYTLHKLYNSFYIDSLNRSTNE